MVAVAIPVNRIPEMWGGRSLFDKFVVFTVWQCVNVTLWQCDILAVWHCGRSSTNCTNLLMYCMHNKAWYQWCTLVWKKVQSKWYILIQLFFPFKIAMKSKDNLATRNLITYQRLKYCWTALWVSPLIPVQSSHVGRLVRKGWKEGNIGQIGCQDYLI